ncbi:MAG: hypothetical protein OXC28_14710 [Defluviicoccus sp.]|nr:hypothetical protein [Defluviicoccus sp.]
MKIPTAYTDGHAKARHVDPDRAANYVARTAIGDGLAGELMFPERRAPGIPWQFHTHDRIEQMMEKIGPGPSRQMANLATMLDVSNFDEGGIGCRLPDRVYAERSSRW